MGESELLLLMLAVGGLSVLAGAVRVPYPIVLVLGGLVLGFVPGMPRVELPPELVLVLFLPFLLYTEAFFSSPRDLRADARAITLLAVGLVLATTCAVAALAHALVALPWAAAFALGAIVSPTDPLAATTIARRLGVPRSLVTLLEGESLVTTRLPWSPTASRWPPRSAGASWYGRPAFGSSPGWSAAWPSGSWSAG
jgi:NhaP-type Na+/H+ or K+/H+ antiporter